jgi:hypothetical protein
MMGLGLAAILGVVLGAAVAMGFGKGRVSPFVHLGLVVALFIGAVLVAQYAWSVAINVTDPAWTPIATLMSWVFAMGGASCGLIGYTVGFFGFRMLERPRTRCLEDGDE